jgi:hypothetical protein
MIKLLFTIFLTLIFASCEWVITHPEEDAEIVELGEKAIQEIYSYETKSLLSLPPQPNAEPFGPQPK